MRHQNRLRQVAGQIAAVFLAQPRPQARRGVAQGLRVQLVQVHARLQGIEQLEGPQAAHGDRAHQFPEPLLAHSQKNIGNLHQRYCNGANPYALLQ